MAHPDGVVSLVASLLAAGGSAAIQGGTLIVTAKDGAASSVGCRTPESAQALLDQATADAATSAYNPVRAAVAKADATLAATNKASLIHERNRWLAQTDPYVLPVSALPDDMPSDVKTVLAAQGTPTVQQQIMTWRQQLRDYPSTVADWTKPLPLPAPPNILLPSGRALIIVT